MWKLIGLVVVVGCVDVPIESVVPGGGERWTCFVAARCAGETHEYEEHLCMPRDDRDWWPVKDRCTDAYPGCGCEVTCSSDGALAGDGILRPCILDAEDQS